MSCCGAANLLRCGAAGLHGPFGANATPVQSKDRPVNANVNSMILKSLPDFGKLFRIVEFTFAFTALCFDCAGAAFMSPLPPSSLAMQQACSTEAPHGNSLAARGSTAVQQGCDASIKNRGLKCNPYLGQKSRKRDCRCQHQAFALQARA